uniref:Uncharacterized protein n=1 Tax=Rhizophora mucronata TaxID=61149 RepID=A0A2P2INJ2_RHIMU
MGLHLMLVVPDLFFFCQLCNFLCCLHFSSLSRYVNCCVFTCH